MKWFAWYPVRTNVGWCWLENVNWHGKVFAGYVSHARGISSRYENRYTYPRN